MKFEELGLSPEMCKIIGHQGFSEPTQIQRESIPLILQGKDIVGESATGSGKTLAFAAGLIENIEPNKGTQGLVLTPTRELAQQVADAIQLFSGRKLRVAAVYGGVGFEAQIDAMEQSDIVVGTPGRLLDHLNKRNLNLRGVKVLVLDEADRMLDMGFIDDVKLLVQECPKERQTLFFSATISMDIERLSREFMTDPIDVTAVKAVDPSKLKQIYYDVHSGMKLSLLIHLLKAESDGLAMVFCNTRRYTDIVCTNLKANGIRAQPIHGGLSQNRRAQIIEHFNTGKFAARGLHIDNVSHVYNYDLPNDPKEYVHRIGRTARAGEEGKVINLLADRDHESFGRILRDYSEFNVEALEKPYVERVQMVHVDDRNRQGNRNMRHRSSGHRNAGPQNARRQHSLQPRARHGGRDSK